MSKKLLKRPTFLEDNAHPSMINDFQQEMIRKKAALFIPTLEIPYFFSRSKAVQCLKCLRSEKDVSFLVT